MENMPGRKVHIMATGTVYKRKLNLKIVIMLLQKGRCNRIAKFLK